LNEVTPQKYHPQEQGPSANLQEQNAAAVYFLKSIIHPNRIYTGVTTVGIEKRLAQHNAGSSHYTSIHKPWQIVAYLTFMDTSAAYAFEEYCKTPSGNRWVNKHIFKRP
jgi:predicted GIY-YIG superfamily endonuclease